MIMEITEKNEATMKGKFVKEKLTTEQLNAEVSKILLDEKIDQLGWF